MRLDRLLRSVAFYTHLVAVAAVAVGAAVYMLALLVLADWVSIKWYCVLSALLAGGLCLLEWAERKAGGL